VRHLRERLQRAFDELSHVRKGTHGPQR
jgi:hypothetical protein